MQMFSPIKLILLVEVLFGASNAEELNLNFQQNDYHLKFERLELVRFSKDFYDDFSIITYKYNRSTAVSNATYTLKVDLGTDVSAIIQLYKFMSNEYRHFPLRFAANVCKAIAANVAGLSTLTKCGNYSGCPFRKGKYHVCKWQPDSAKFPPFIPNGQYKMEVQVLYFSREVGVANAYGTVDRPIV